MPTRAEVDAANEPFRAKTYAELRAMSDETLIRIHDWLARSRDPDGKSERYTDVGLDYYRDELARRAASQVNDQMLAYTAEMTALTRTIHRLSWMMAIAAGASLIASFAAVFIAIVK